MRGGWGTADNMGFLCPSWVDATHDSTTGGSTSRGGGVRLPELDPFPGQGVDMRGLHWAGFVNVIAFDILPSKVIGQDEDDIGLFRSGFGDERCQRDQYEQDENGKRGSRFVHGYGFGGSLDLIDTSVTLHFDPCTFFLRVSAAVIFPSALVSTFGNC